MEPVDRQTTVAPLERQRLLARLLSVTAIPILVAVAYARTLPAPFFFDDTSTILLNPTIQNLRPLRLVFVGTRPILNFSYALTYQLSGRSPAGHRLANIVLHVLNALLVYAWLRLALRLPRCARQDGFGHVIALAVALLFAVHPLQTESVTYISGRAEVLAGFFILTGMVLLALALQPSATPRRAAALRAGAVAAAVGGVLSKESAAVLPVLLLLFETLAGGRLRCVLRAHWLMYASLAVTWLIPAAFLWRHPEYAETAGFSFGAQPYGIAPLDYLYTQAGVIVHYLRLSLLPVSQVFDYDWPLARSPLSPAVWAPALMLVALASLVPLLWRRAPLYAFAILWFFVTLAPTSSIVPIADVIAERRMYVPLVGLLTAIVLLVADGVRSAGSSRRALVSAAGLTALTSLVALTYARNAVWSDPLALWRDTVLKAPGNPRAHTNLGIRYLQRGEVQAARTEFERAIELVEEGRSPQALPRHAAFAAAHLALVHLQLGNREAAREAYTAALEFGAAAYPELSQPLQQARTALERAAPSEEEP